MDLFHRLPASSNRSTGQAKRQRPTLREAISAASIDREEQVILQQSAPQSQARPVTESQKPRNMRAMQLAYMSKVLAEEALSLCMAEGNEEDCAGVIDYVNAKSSSLPPHALDSELLGSSVTDSSAVEAYLANYRPQVKHATRFAQGQGFGAPLHRSTSTSSSSTYYSSPHIPGSIRDQSVNLAPRPSVASLSGSTLKTSPSSSSLRSSSSDASSRIQLPFIGAKRRASKVFEPQRVSGELPSMHATETSAVQSRSGSTVSGSLSQPSLRSRSIGSESCVSETSRAMNRTLLPEPSFSRTRSISSDSGYSSGTPMSWHSYSPVLKSDKTFPPTVTESRLEVPSLESTSRQDSQKTLTLAKCDSSPISLETTPKQKESKSPISLDTTPKQKEINLVSFSSPLLDDLNRGWDEEEPIGIDEEWQPRKNADYRESLDSFMSDMYDELADAVSNLTKDFPTPPASRKSSVASTISPLDFPPLPSPPALSPSVSSNGSISSFSSAQYAQQQPFSDRLQEFSRALEMEASKANISSERAKGSLPTPLATSSFVKKEMGSTSIRRLRSARSVASLGLSVSSRSPIATHQGQN